MIRKNAKHTKGMEAATSSMWEFPRSNDPVSSTQMAFQNGKGLGIKKRLRGYMKQMQGVKLIWILFKQNDKKMEEILIIAWEFHNSMILLNVIKELSLSVGDIYKYIFTSKQIW